jgi:endonuclease-3 related protein
VSRRRAVRDRLLRLYDAALRALGPQHWWPAKSRFEVAVGAILTQNTAWTNVERAIANLKRAGLLSPDSLARVSLGTLAGPLRPSGYFRVKARRLRSLILHLRRHHGGRLQRMLARPLPTVRAELLTIPGIGPETADSILLYAGNHPVFVVDAYTRRIFSRHRLVSPEVSYERLQRTFMEHLPRDPALFNEYHALLVHVGKEFCRSRPRCGPCPLRFDLGGRSPRP